MAFIVFIFSMEYQQSVATDLLYLKDFTGNFLNDLEHFPWVNWTWRVFFFNHPKVVLGDWTSLVSKARCFLKLIKSRIDIKRPRTFARCTNKRQHCKGALEVKQVQSLAQIPSTSSTTSMAEIIILTRIF